MPLEIYRATRLTMKKPIYETNTLKKITVGKRGWVKRVIGSNVTSLDEVLYGS